MKCALYSRETQPLWHTARSTLYRLHTDSGTRILKLAPAWTCPHPLAHEYRILQVLHDRALPVRAPRSLGYGEGGGVAWLLREEVAGQTGSDLLADTANTPQEKERWFSRAGAALAALHASTTTDAAPEACLAYALERAAHNLAHALYDPDEFAATPPPQEVYCWLTAHPPHSLRACLLHGDYRPKNLFASPRVYRSQPRPGEALCASAGSLALIDWEHSLLGDPYYDLAIFTYYCDTPATLESLLAGYGLPSLDVEKLRYFDLLSKFLNI